jgi:hypothetical protein
MSRAASGSASHTHLKMCVLSNPRQDATTEQHVWYAVGYCCRLLHVHQGMVVSTAKCTQHALLTLVATRSGEEGRMRTKHNGCVNQPLARRWLQRRTALPRGLHPTTQITQCHFMLLITRMLSL